MICDTPSALQVVMSCVLCPVKKGLVKLSCLRASERNRFQWSQSAGAEEN